MGKIVISDTRVRVSVTKKIQDRQFEPYEVSASVETTVDKATVDLLPTILDKLYIQIDDFVLEKISDHMEND